MGTILIAVLSYSFRHMRQAPMCQPYPLIWLARSTAETDTQVSMCTSERAEQEVVKAEPFCQQPNLVGTEWLFAQCIFAQASGGIRLLKAVFWDPPWGL